MGIPITNDQPGVGARLVYSGAGKVVSLSHLTVPKLRQAVQQVLTQERYRHHAHRLQAAIQRTGGVQQAVDIIEQVLDLPRSHLLSCPKSAPEPPGIPRNTICV